MNANALHYAAIQAIKDCAGKARANPEILAKFLQLAEPSTSPRAVSLSSPRWRKKGVIARCSTTLEKSTSVEYELSVVTVWEGLRYTLVTRIWKIVPMPGNAVAFEEIARAEDKGVFAPYPGSTQ